jgi:hypothetical protein
VIGVASGSSGKAREKPKGSSVVSAGVAVGGVGADGKSASGRGCERGDDADDADLVSLSKGLLLFTLIPEGLAGSGETGKDTGKGSASAAVIESISGDRAKGE